MESPNPPPRSSRLRFAGYLEKRRKDPAGKDDQAPEKRRGPRHRSLWTLYRELNRTLRGDRGLIVGSLAWLSLATALKLVPPAATKFVIDQVLLDKPFPKGFPSWMPIPGDPRMRLLMLVAVVFVVALVSTAVGLMGRWQATLASKRLQITMRRRVFEHASRLPLHRVQELKSGGVSSLLREDAGGVGELVFSMIYNPWRAVVQLAGGLLVLIWVDWRLLLAAIALLPALFLTDRLWNRRLRPLYRDVRRTRQEIDARSAEAFGGIRVVRAFGRLRRESSRFTGENDYMARQEFHGWWWTRWVEILWDLLLPAASGSLLLYGGSQVLNHQLSIGELMMFLVYLAMLLEPLAVLATSVTQLQNNLSGFDRVLDVLAEPREMADHPGSIVVHKPRVSGRITLEGVDFAYPNSEEPVLREIDLDVQPGETIALVGRSGAGKTTLCNLIARFHDPSRGTIRLDGVDLREITLDSYRSLLGIVEQDVFLFDGTIAENIAYSRPRASISEVIQAAEVANAAEFIDLMPLGYGTVIGERGVRLSGGQRQRLAIARAVLADPKVFILDEATSSLDTASERHIQRGLASLLRNRTSFVIAHRLSTIRSADRILVLDSGRIVESGSHDLLMFRDGPYRQMVLMQGLDPSEADFDRTATIAE